MSDIPRQAVEAAARALCNYDGVDPDRPCVIAQPYEDWYDTRYRAHDGPAWKAWEYEAEASLAAALPHLASAQPQPSEPLPVNYYKDQFGNFRYAPDAIAKARAAALDECEEIARRELSGQWPEWDMRVRRIADANAALKRGPVAEESGE